MHLHFVSIFSVFSVSLYDFTFIMLVQTLILSVIILNSCYNRKWFPAWIRKHVLRSCISYIVCVDIRNVLYHQQAPKNNHECRSTDDVTTPSDDVTTLHNKRNVSVQYNHQSENEDEKNIQHEWQLLAKIMDRIFFLISFCCIFIAWVVFVSHAKQN